MSLQLWGDVITLRNHATPYAVTLPTLVGGIDNSTNASIMIKRIAVP